MSYTGKLPDVAPKDMKFYIENTAYIKTLPWFQEFDEEIANELASAVCYICFSDRDPCPNSVIESMAHGLPVVGIASGGIPDIVGDAGELLPGNDFDDGLFSAHRWEYDFSKIDFNLVYDALQKVLDDQDKYTGRVRRRFLEELDITVTAERYAVVLRNLSGQEF